jgi:hypothetical protein
MLIAKKFFSAYVKLIHPSQIVCGLKCVTFLLKLNIGYMLCFYHYKFIETIENLI